jgi:hypothetical protein
MKKYTRISCPFLSRDTDSFSGLNEDTKVSKELNDKLQIFLKENKVKDYQIINAETVLVPNQNSFSAYNLACLHVTYEV